MRVPPLYLARSPALLGGPGASWQTVASTTHDGTNNALAAITGVNLVKTAAITAPTGTVTKVRVTVRGNFDRMYIGPQASSGDAYDASSLTQLTFGGSAGNAAGNGVDVVSDEVAFTWNKTDQLLVSFDSASAKAVSYGNAAADNIDLYYSFSITNEGATANKSSSGYFLTADTYILKKIEVLA